MSRALRTGGCRGRTARVCFFSSFCVFALHRRHLFPVLLILIVFVGHFTESFDRSKYRTFGVSYLTERPPSPDIPVHFCFADAER